jgi:hypothetical protein
MIAAVAEEGSDAWPEFIRQEFQANRFSGRVATRPGQFLRSGARGPERQQLLKLIDTLLEGLGKRCSGRPLVLFAARFVVVDALARSAATSASSVLAMGLPSRF